MEHKALEQNDTSGRREQDTSGGEASCEEDDAKAPFVQWPLSGRL